jgi:hypothetical protein
MIHVSHTSLLRVMYKIRGDGAEVHFNIGLSDIEKAELDSISLETLLATHKSAFSSGVSLYRGVDWDKNHRRGGQRLALTASTKDWETFSLKKMLHVHMTEQRRR